MKEFKYVNSPKTLDGLRVVQNYDDIINILRSGETIAHWERGNSMFPILRDSQYVRLEPIHEQPQVGDAVYCCVHGYWMCHMVWVVNRHTNQCLIGSTSGDLYGWTDEIIAIGKPMPYLEIPHVEDIEEVENTEEK